MLAVAHQELGPRAVGMTAVSPSLAPAERDEAAAVAALIGADHRLVASSEIDDPSYVANNPDRCFHCKSELYRIASKMRVEWALDAIVNGTNIDDLESAEESTKDVLNIECLLLDDMICFLKWFFILVLVKRES